MKAIEFQTFVNKGSIKIPNQYDINNENVKVIILYEESKRMQNYEKEKLLSTISRVNELGVFAKIENSVLWQKQLRDEWE